MFRKFILLFVISLFGFQTFSQETIIAIKAGKLFDSEKGVFLEKMTNFGA